MDECLRITHKLPYYDSPEAKINGQLSWADVPFWKLPFSIYEILAYWVGLPFEDYPAQIGPICGELHLLSYVDSYITLSSHYNLC